MNLTVGEAIAKVDWLCPNSYESDLKLSWLNELDGALWEDIFKTHHGCERLEWSPNESEGDELLVPYPYAEKVYIHYLESKIDYFNGEIGKYNQSALQFNSAKDEFASWYNRTHKPKGRRKFLI